jgi:acyl-CoA thioester hydrolase
MPGGSGSATFRWEHRVTYAECTVGNHIYHSRYLDVLEAVRGEFLRSLGHPVLELQEAGFIFPVIETRLKYHQPARYDDRLTVEVGLVELTRLRLGVAHWIRSESGDLLVEAVTHHVCTGLDDRPRRMPVGLWEVLQTRVLDLMQVERWWARG